MILFKDYFYFTLLILFVFITFTACPVATLDSPQNVTATDGCSERIIVSWDAVTSNPLDLSKANADFYRVYRSNSTWISLGMFFQISSDIEGTSYTDYTAIQDDLYYYRVKAFTDSDIESVYSEYDEGYASDEKDGTECLPHDINFRNNTESFNTRYYVVVFDGDIWIKEKDSFFNVWTNLADAMGDEFPQDLAGDVTEISAEDINIIALNSERRVFTMFGALEDISEFYWYETWGFPFWFGPGMNLTTDLMNWEFSLVDPNQDGNWTDPIGNLHPVGDANCSHIIMLRNEGQWITFNDPWLPTDLSYGIGMPERCRFKAANMSASGSTTFVINKYGDMFTRLYDFDLSGMDDFLLYSYDDQSDKLLPKIQLPPEDWKEQPKINGQITDRISIHKLGLQQNCMDRILRVEGLDEDGNTGYYEKPMNATGNNSWMFHRTGHDLMGNILSNTADDMSHASLGPSEDIYYSVNMDNIQNLDPDKYTDWAGEMLDFNCYCPPHTLRIHISPESHFDLLVHTTEAIRLLQRERGIDDNPRKFLGSIEVPDEIFNNLENQNQKTRNFINGYLNGEKFTTINIFGTLSELEIQLKDKLTGLVTVNIFKLYP